MNYADRIQESTTATSTATITLGGAAAKYRSFASALVIGATGIPVCVESATDWEIGTYTLTDAATLTREALLSSSNGGAAVTFAAGTKDVMCVMPSAALAAGLTNPNDAGFDIVLCAGQSNMEGNPASDANIDIGDPRVFQWANSSADTGTYRQIITGADPLYMPGGVRAGKVGPATWFAKSYLMTIPQNRKVLLVPVAVGSTGLVGSVWQSGSPGGTYYERAIADTSLAIAAALLWYPNSRFVGTIWAQGEADGLNGTTQAQYAAGLKAVIAGFRARITGAASSWFVISAMTPEGIAAHTGEAVINLAHQQVAIETDKCAFVPSVSGMAADVHYTAPGIRIMGSRLGLAVKTAIAHVGVDATPPTAVSASVANATPTTASIAVSEALDAAYVPAASAFTVSGHTVSGVAISGSTVTLTTSTFVASESATVAYTQPGTNNIRDLAGNLLANFAGLAITDNVVAAANAVTLTGPASGVSGVASSNFSVGVSPVGGAITGTNTVTPSDASGGGTFAPTSVSLTTASPAATFTYTPSSTGAKTISVTNNGGLSNPSSITYTASAAATVPGAPTIGTATAGDASVSVTFTAPASDGGSAITSYTVTMSTGQTATGASSPITVTGMTNGTPATATVHATNAIGNSAESAASNSVTPASAGATYTTFNPADTASGITLSNGNLTAAGTSGYKSTRAIAGKTTGKWQCEYKLTAGTLGVVGFGRIEALTSSFPGSNANSWGLRETGQRYYANAAVETLTAFVVNDVVGVAVDMDAKTGQFYKNGTALGSPFTLTVGAGGATISAGVAIYPMAAPNASTVVLNSGATPFAFPIAGYGGFTS